MSKSDRPSPSQFNPELPENIEREEWNTLPIPHRRLMLEILRTAVLDLQSTQETIRMASTHWLYSPANRYVFDCRIICEYLGFDQERLVLTLEKKGLLSRTAYLGIIQESVKEDEAIT